MRAERARPEISLQGGAGVPVSRLKAREHEPVAVVGGAFARRVLCSEDGLGDPALNLEHQRLLKPWRCSVGLKCGGGSSARKSPAEIAAPDEGLAVADGLCCGHGMAIAIAAARHTSRARDAQPERERRVAASAF